MRSVTRSVRSLSRPSQHRRRQGRHHKSLGRTLCVLHGLNVLFSLVSLCLFAAVIPIWNANFFHKTSTIKGDWPDALPILPLSIALAASAHSLTKLVLSRRDTGKSTQDYLKARNKIPATTRQSSKLQLYIILTVMILLLTFLVLAGISGLYRFWRPDVITSSMRLSSGNAFSGISISTLSLRRSLSDSNPMSLTPPADQPSGPSSSHTQKATISCTLANVFSQKCNPTLYLIGNLQIAAIATASFVWLLHLALLIIQVREYQYLNRKNQRGLRNNARAKLDMIEDDFSKAEKGQSPSSKQRMNYQVRASDSNATFDPNLSTVARPQPSALQPKRHYYNPDITASRSRDLHENSPEPRDDQRNPGQLQTPYSQAVEEARRKLKPTESMRQWLAGRNT